MYVPFACGGGCPRYAADVGDPDFRADFLDYCTALVSQHRRKDAFRVLPRERKRVSVTDASGNVSQ